MNISVSTITQCHAYKTNVVEFEFLSLGDGGALTDDEGPIATV